MDFAKKILNKYGWKEGEGLGKNNNGIKKPLKANLKFDQAGFGEKQAESDFNNHWWARVFNDATKNIEVKSLENGEVAMKLKDEADGVEISTKSYSLSKLKKTKKKSGNADEQRYSHFLLATTLTNTGDEIENVNKIENIEVTQYKTLTDEQLFQACGGRTAHKGARHGLKLSGKITRLEQQERELLEIMQKKYKQKEIERDIKTKKIANSRSYDSSPVDVKRSNKRKLNLDNEVNVEQIPAKGNTTAQIVKNKTAKIPQRKSYRKKTN